MFHKLLAKGDGHGFGAVGGAKFDEQVFDMFFYYGPADAELIRDFRVVESFDER